MLIFRGVCIFILIFRGKWVIVIAVNLFICSKSTTATFLACHSRQDSFVLSGENQHEKRLVNCFFCVCVCESMFTTIWPHIMKMNKKNSHSPQYLLTPILQMKCSLFAWWHTFPNRPEGINQKTAHSGPKKPWGKTSSLFLGGLPWIVHVDGSRWRVLLSRLSRLWKHGQLRYHFLRRQRGP